MEQQTAMQEMLEYLEKYKSVAGITAVMPIEKCKSLLKREMASNVSTSY